MTRKRKKQKGKSGKPRHWTKDVRIGVAWYESEEEWANVRAFAADPGRLEETYQEWLAVAEKALEDIAAAGVVPEKVALDARRLKEWCGSNGRENDASTRAELASRLLSEKYERRK